MIWNNLRNLRLERGWSYAEVAGRMGITPSSFKKLERGERMLTSRTIALAARAFGVDPASIISNRATVPIIGLVTEDGEVMPAKPPHVLIAVGNGVTPHTAALRIVGGFGGFWREFVIVFEHVRNGTPADFYGTLCIVGLPGGQVMVRKVFRSALETNNVYHLHSALGDPLLYAEVAWAAPVRCILPPD